MSWSTFFERQSSSAISLFPGCILEVLVVVLIQVWRSSAEEKKQCWGCGCLHVDLDVMSFEIVVVDQFDVAWDSYGESVQ